MSPLTMPLGVIPELADFAVCSMPGPEGKLVAVGEWLNGDAFIEYQHAIILNSMSPRTVVEAEVKGATTERLYSWAAGRELIKWSAGAIQLTQAERVRIAAAATHYAELKVGYSWADYVALGLRRLHVPAPGLLAYIKSTGHMMCSQLVDQCYLDAGVHLFTDGRPAGYVTPADLADLIAMGPGWGLHRGPVADYLRAA